MSWIYVVGNDAQNGWNSAPNLRIGLGKWESGLIMINHFIAIWQVFPEICGNARYFFKDIVNFIDLPRCAFDNTDVLTMTKTH